MPCAIAYSQSASFICGDFILRPTLPSTDFTPTRNLDRSSVPITFHITRAACVDEIASSGTANVIVACERFGFSKRMRDGGWLVMAIRSSGIRAGCLTRSFFYTS